MKYMIVAGEASGDLHASGLIDAIRKIDASSEFCFFGGDLMEKAAGVHPYVHYTEMNVMGFSEVLRKLPQLLKHLKIAKRLLSEFRPDALIMSIIPVLI